MSALLNPLSFVVACLSGWLSQHQQFAIDYLTEENRVLREHLGGKRLRFTDDLLPDHLFSICTLRDTCRAHLAREFCGELDEPISSGPEPCP
jgi:hypothetical protein